MENGHFVTPMDHPIRGGAHSTSHWYLGGRSNERHPSSINMDLQQLLPPFSRPPFDPSGSCCVFEGSSNGFYGEGSSSSTNGNTSFSPVDLVGHIHFTHGTAESGPLKRKAPCVCEGSLNSFYGEGSSSSSQMPIQEPDVVRRSRAPYMGSDLSINGQGSVRNVRRRSGPEFEPCMTRAHALDYASRYYQPITHSAKYSAPAHAVNPSADVTGRDWNIVPYAASYHGRTSHSDINDPRRGTSQFYAGASSFDIDVSHYNPFFGGYLASSSQNPHVQPTSNGHNYHHQRVKPFYRNGPVYCNYNTGSGGGGYRGGRPQITVERLQPPVDVIDSSHGYGHETVTVEQPSFYHEPESFPDQYQDMRLNIDSMSYEELLALEERIGFVRSGMSAYYSTDQNHDTCPICLEEYKNGEKIGRIEKCGHEYHVDCIKKWTATKKVCPICKSEC